MLKILLKLIFWEHFFTTTDSICAILLITIQKLPKILTLTMKVSGVQFLEDFWENKLSILYVY